MTTLKFEPKKMRGPRLGGASVFPAMRDPISSLIAAELGEYDELFINFGMFTDSLPYTMQDQYDTPAAEQTFTSAVLENDHLRAVFILELGGRLWSLYDKDAGRDLLLDNPEFRPGNLAIRNAWFAGGIEYNIGRRGHDAQTCSPRFAATLKDDDGTPVLRFYEFSRDRAIPFQIDFYLPENSRFLFARPRIMNIRNEMIPMYYWSNIAVPQLPGERIVVPASDTYVNRYSGGNHFIAKIALPDGEGFDGTYPENFPAVRDHFYNIPADSRKYEAVMFRDGYGFLFASTRRLQGRKLFVWGENPGGKHWQRKLMPPGVPDYIEIQGGLAKSQQECLPMPPATVWEWLEAYGPVTAAPERLFGKYEEAVATVSAAADRVLPEARLDAELARTLHSFAVKPGKVVMTGSGWGALEELRRGRKLAAHLDFGSVQPEQADWVELLKNGVMPETEPKGYLIQPEWKALLLGAKKHNWKTKLHLALHFFREKDFERTEAALRDSLAFRRNAYNEFAFSQLCRVTDRAVEALAGLEKLCLERPDDASLAKETLKIFIEQKGDPVRILALCDRLSAEVRSKPMIRFCRACALAHAGRIDEAEALITANGGLEIPDIREGENSISELYLFLQKEKAGKQGRTLSDTEIEVPFALDLRMKL